jgi:Nuclease-related domain
MRIVTLSDHPGDMLADAVSERQRGTVHQETGLNDARRRRDQARAERRWLRWLRLVFTVRREAREVARQRLSARRPTGREESLRAGHDAEQRVADNLSRALNGDWELFLGYRNRRGEIDGLLVGPGGLFAYEVKYHNATVHISGDDWQSEKFDRYGNQVSDRAPMTDKRGRSPSRQLSEPAAMLADWLGKRGYPVSVTPVVLLTHERARVGSIRNPTVDVETSVQGLLRLVKQSPSALGASQRAAIAQIIRDDHRHHQRR